MSEFPAFGRPRVILVSGNLTERALIAAQLQAEVPCKVEGAATIRDALALLVTRAALVILDWSGLQPSVAEWSRLVAGARGAPVLVIAGNADREQIDELAVKPTRVLCRPLTVGDVVSQALQLLSPGGKNGRSDGGHQSSH